MGIRMLTFVDDMVRSVESLFEEMTPHERDNLAHSLGVEHLANENHLVVLLEQLPVQAMLKIRDRVFEEFSIHHLAAA